MIINNLTKTITDLYTAGAINSQDIDNHIKSLSKLKTKKAKPTAKQELRAKKTMFEAEYNGYNLFKKNKT